MKAFAKLIPCIMIIVLMAALIVTKTMHGTSNAFLGYSSLSTSISYQTANE